MASFSEASLVKKLGDLNHTQQSIQTLSLWLIHHRKHAQSIVEVWYKMLKNEEVERKLVFFYLLNDVVQNSKKKGPEYNKAFQTVIVDAYKHAYKLVNDKTAGSMARLVKIWEERSVFSMDLLMKIRKVISKGEKKRSRSGSRGQSAESEGSSKSSKSSKQPTIEAYEPPVKEHKEHKKSHKDKSKDKSSSRDPRKIEKEKEKEKEKKDLKRSVSVDKKAAPVEKKRKSGEGGSLREQIAEFLEKNKRDDREVPEAEDLVKAINDLEHAASFDAVVREQIAKLPPEVSDTTALTKVTDRESAEVLSAKVDAASNILEEYNVRLKDELDERKRMAIMLSDYIAHQKEQLQSDQQKLEEVKSKLEKVGAVRKELEAHISSLPDFSLLPNFNVGLTPLPSAGDLFSAGEH